MDAEWCERSDSSAVCGPSDVGVVDNAVGCADDTAAVSY